MSWRACLALALLLVGRALAVRAEAQATEPSDVEGRTARYADPAFGFELQLPSGWDYDRSRFKMSFRELRNCIGLLRGRSPDGERSLQIMVFRSFPMSPFEEWIVDFGQILGDKTLSERVKWESWRIPPRAGAVLTTTSKTGGRITRAHYLCVPFDPNTIWVLMYSGLAWDEEGTAPIRQEFEIIANSLKVRYDPDEVERLGPAYDRGRALLDKLKKHAERVQVDEELHRYEITIAGKPVGYMERRMSRAEHVFSRPDAKRRYAKQGLRVSELSWDFGEDGTTRLARIELFSSFDLRTEQFEYTTVQVPGPDAAVQKPLMKTEQVVREDNVLFATSTSSAESGLPDPSRPLDVGPVYLDQAWGRLLPGLMLTEPPEPLAVAVYNIEACSLVAHVIKPLGKRELPGRDEPAYAFEIREGFVSQPSLLYCDERGVLLRVEAGDIVLQLVPSAEIESKYGERRDKTRLRLKAMEEAGQG